MCLGFYNSDNLYSVASAITFIYVLIHWYFWPLTSQWVWSCSSLSLCVWDREQVSMSYLARAQCSAVVCRRQRSASAAGSFVFRQGSGLNCVWCCCAEAWGWKELSLCVCLRRRRAFVYRNPLPPPHSRALSLCLTTLQYPSSNEAGNGGWVVLWLGVI